jgi:hypothetical protein
MTRQITFAILFTMLAVFLTSGSLAANDADSLPIYPHTNKGGTAHEPSNEKAISNAIAQGATAKMFTSDPPQTVDRWYRDKLPKSCSRNALTETTIQYTCATRAVSISPQQGQTIIILGPKP